MECYKVVSKKYRYGTNASGFIQKYGFDKFESFLNEYSSIKKYFPKYEKGTIVKSAKKSIGILCFVDELAADDFISNNHQLSKTFWSCRAHKVKIIKVNGINQLKSSYIKAGGMDIKIFLDIDNGELSPPPEGTLFFEKVEVLE